MLDPIVVSGVAVTRAYHRIVAIWCVEDYVLALDSWRSARRMAMSLYGPRVGTSKRRATEIHASTNSPPHTPTSIMLAGNLLDS
jgi:hypothetical protein